MEYLHNKLKVNDIYKFRDDLHRIIITYNNSAIIDFTHKDYFGSFTWIVHPVLAYIFSFFDGRNSVYGVYQKTKELLDISLDEFYSTIKKFIYNQENVIIPIKELGYNAVPKNFLIVCSDDSACREELMPPVDINEMLESLDLTTNRNYIPNEFTIMLTDNCCTDCIYCYADRSHHIKEPIPFPRIKELIKEAYEIGMRDIGVDGGDFFLYPHWHELLAELNKYGFKPYISTKFPITERIVEKLKSVGVSRIQQSLDSVQNDEIVKILKVKEDYLDKVKHGIKLMQEANIEVVLKPVITKYNDSVESIEKLLSFATGFENIKEINLTPADYSQYKNFDYPSTKKQLSLIETNVSGWETKYQKKIKMLGYGTKESTETKSKSFPNRSICSGNVSSFFVLPDGKVTICEQMYWHPFFILGNISKQSIMDMWTSEKALALWNFSQNEVRSCSPCKSCGDFEKCHRGKGNCWRLAITAYGGENYDFPAPNCPKAPKEINNIYIQ